jgi:hypothetical protein
MENSLFARNTRISSEFRSTVQRIIVFSVQGVSLHKVLKQQKFRAKNFHENYFCIDAIKVVFHVHSNGTKIQLA